MQNKSYLQSELLNSIRGIRHGFGNQTQPIPEVSKDFIKNWPVTRPKWKQVHGTQSIEVIAPAQECGETDALWTKQALITVGVVTADCVPLLFAEKKTKAVVAIHAGWRGTLNRIVKKTMHEILANTHTEPSDWVAAIGPCIRECCYEVGTDLIDRFLTEYAFIPKEKVQPDFRKLALQNIHTEELDRLGFKEVDILKSCTYCSVRQSENNFFSYRRDKNSSRQWSIIFKDH